MAINKEIETSKGVNASYWTINSIKMYGRESLNVIGVIDGYYNQEAYDNGADKLDNIRFTMTDVSKEDVMTYEGLYQFLMANIEQFKDSEAILEVIE